MDGIVSAFREPVTASMASMLFELYLQQQGLRFTRGSNADAIQFSVPFAGGYRYIITFRDSRGVLATMHATFNDKISETSKRAEASTYFAMINFTLAFGCFQLDLRDGEILYWTGIPLEGMSANDCSELLTSWFQLFRASFNGYRDNINVLLRGGTIQEAIRA